MNKDDTSEKLFQKGVEAEQAKDYQKARMLLEQSLSSEKDAFNIMVCRNILGRVYEKLGDVETATKLYEQNVADEFEGDFPYDRLRIIYHKQNRFADEVRILEKAIKVFDEKVKTNSTPT
jgi:tetratricopeptide (TPR) repeat protein